MYSVTYVKTVEVEHRAHYGSVACVTATDGKYYETAFHIDKINVGTKLMVSTVDNKFGRRTVFPAKY